VTVQGDSRTVVLAVPVASLRRGISLQEFAQVVADGRPLGPDRIRAAEEAERQAEFARKAEAAWKKKLAEEEAIARARQAAEEKEQAAEAAKRVAEDMKRAEEKARLAREEEARKQTPEYKAAQAKLLREKMEADAKRKLKLATAFLNEAIDKERRGSLDEADRLMQSARRRLEEIVATYPQTAAAAEAGKLLDQHKSR
jgi:hypothetical protein